MKLLVPLLLCASLAHAQFDLEESHTTASLRGIDSLGAGVAWASGSNGTVLRTEDGGYLWQPCTVPKGGEALDFRGVQGFDANTAVVMASGKGALSRIYRTTDGCQSWKLVFENPDETGFFDDLRKVTARQIYLLGDPVDGKFPLFFSPDQGATWFATDDPGRESLPGEGAFAASNSGLIALGNTVFFGTGSAATARIFHTAPHCASAAAAKDQACPLAWQPVATGVASGSAGAGVFSLAGRVTAAMSGKLYTLLVAVGGDYTRPDLAAGTAAISRDGGTTWQAPTSGPGGFRSAVAFDASTQTWLAVGPGGADVSHDDGRSWKPLQGDTSGHWNAVSLPFAVGPNGRIGKLRDGVLKP